MNLSDFEPILMSVQSYFLIHVVLLLPNKSKYIQFILHQRDSKGRHLAASMAYTNPKEVKGLESRDRDG